VLCCAHSLVYKVSGVHLVVLKCSVCIRPKIHVREVSHLTNLKQGFCSLNWWYCNAVYAVSVTTVVCCLPLPELSRNGVSVSAGAVGSFPIATISRQSHTSEANCCCCCCWSWWCCWAIASNELVHYITHEFPLNLIHLGLLTASQDFPLYPDLLYLLDTLLTWSSVMKIILFQDQNFSCSIKCFNVLTSLTD